MKLLTAPLLLLLMSLAALASAAYDSTGVCKDGLFQPDPNKFYTIKHWNDANWGWSMFMPREFVVNLEHQPEIYGGNKFLAPPNFAKPESHWLIGKGPASAGPGTFTYQNRLTGNMTYAKDKGGGTWEGTLSYPLAGPQVYVPTACSA